MSFCVLIRNGHHQRPMHAVLERYCIGNADQYGRGVWIAEKDLQKIQKAMDADPTAVRGTYNGKEFLFVQGTNRHNHVQYADFAGLFGGNNGH